MKNKLFGAWARAFCAAAVLFCLAACDSGSGGKFVAVGDNGKMANSSDGVTWTAVPDSTFGTSNINSIAWVGGKFVAGGYQGKMVYSSDGVTWTAVGDSTFGTSNINSIAWGNNKFVAGGWDGKMAYSSDGENWTGITP